jgi:hypothetical protein
MDTNGGRWGEPRINLNSGTHEQINQPVSRQDAKAQGGQGAEGECSRKTRKSGKQEESRFNHRGPPRGTEGERKRGRGEGDNINKESSMFKVLVKMAYGNGRMRNVLKKHSF